MKKSFKESGYTKLSNIFDKSIINRAYIESLELVEKIRAGKLNNSSSYKKDSVIRTINPHVFSPAIKELLTESRLGIEAATVTKSKSIQIWGSQLYVKLPQSTNSTVGLHTDFQYVKCFKNKVLTAWIPLNNITIKAGSLIYIPKSNSFSDSIEHLTDADCKDINKQREVIKNNLPSSYDWEEVISDTNIGDLFFHDHKTIHGSNPNMTLRPRIAIAVGLVTDSTEFEKKHDYFGYINQLSHKEVCPVIYEK